MRTSTLALLFLFATTAQARIEIETDQDKCVDGWLSMDVTVRLDEQAFHFDPSCDFSFSQSFQKNEGLNCQIESGMCSGFSPEKQIDVRCEDGASESTEVRCPTKP